MFPTGFAKVLLALGSAYGAVGAVVAAAFLLVGLERMVPAARGSYAFRPLIVPGLVLLWPLVAWRWAIGPGPGQRPAARPHRRAHALVWALLAALLPTILIAAWMQRHYSVPVPASVRLSPPEGSLP